MVANEGSMMDMRLSALIRLFFTALCLFPLQTRKRMVENVLTLEEALALAKAIIET